MNTLFAGGDVGGAKALLAVMQACAGQKLPFRVLDHGFLSTAAPSGYVRMSLRGFMSPDPQAVFSAEQIGAVVFSSSVKDATALVVARAAKASGVSTIHVLDNWTSYGLRMVTDGCDPFIPDYYVVMDEYARQEAIKDGVPAEIIRVMGQPALASLALEAGAQKNRERAACLSKIGMDPSRKAVVFVSEPVELDQGASAASATYRGYTEKSVLELFCLAAQDAHKDVDIGLLCHPREDGAGMSATWERCRGKLSGRVLDVKEGRHAVFPADGVVGMASILLYEAWLLGKAVLSLQPGLKTAALRMLQHRSGVLFVDRENVAGTQIKTWIANVTRGRAGVFNPELTIHTAAPGRIVELIGASLQKK